MPWCCFMHLLVFLEVCVFGGSRWPEVGYGKDSLWLISYTFIKKPKGKENLEYNNMGFETQNTQTLRSQSL